MDQRLILYKLQKYQNKLESGTGDTSMYNAKIEYYQDEDEPHSFKECLKKQFIYRNLIYC
jgi:hypothetical protein